MHQMSLVTSDSCKHLQDSALLCCHCHPVSLLSFFIGKLVSPDHWKRQFDKSARTEAEMSVLVLLFVVECWQPLFSLRFTERTDRLIHGGSGLISRVSRLLY